MRSRSALRSTITVLLSAGLAACVAEGGGTSAPRRAHDEAPGTMKEPLTVVTNGAFTNVYVYPDPSAETWDEHIRRLSPAPADAADITQEAIDAFTDRLMDASRPSYFDTLRQYDGIEPPQFFGSSSVSQSCIDAAMKDAANAGGVMQSDTIRSLANCHADGMDPSPQLNLIFSPEISIGKYVLAGVGDVFDMCTTTSTVAWHAGGLNVPNFTAIPTAAGCAPSFEKLTHNISHEVVETLTDPAGFGYGGLGQTIVGEVADVCEGDDLGITGFNVKDPDTRWGGFLVARYWSQSNGDCEPRVDPGTPPPTAHTWLDASAAPLVRFTGDVHDLTRSVPAKDVGHEIAALTLTISTGNDDLRGGTNAGDDCDVSVKLASGQIVTASNVNQGQTWNGWTKNTVALPLPAGTKGGDVQAITLHTGFGGGIGGDNWNVERVQLMAKVLPLPPPTVSFVFPSVGDSAGGTLVRIDGTSFEVDGSVDGSTNVFFGDTPSPKVTCATPTSCTAVAPPGSGVQPIKVVVDGVATIAATPFSYSPSIVGLSESAGSAGDVVTITGIGIGGASAIAFGPYRAQTFTCWNQPASCRVTVPAGTGTVDVRVTVGGETTPVSPATSFAFAAPAIKGLIPTSGPASGDTDVTIEGSGFDTAPGNVQVSFGGVLSPRVLCSSSTSCTAQSPAGAAGPVDVRLTTFGQTTAITPADVFQYSAYAHITSFTYSSFGDVALDGLAPAGGAPITITCSDRSLMTPTTVTVPAGQLSVSGFVLPLHPPTTAENVTLTATYATSSATITVYTSQNPTVPVLKLTAPIKLPFTSGITESATVTLGALAPPGGAVIALTSSDPVDASVPATVTVPAGANTASVPITSHYLGTLRAVTITASYSGSSSTQTIGVGAVTVQCHAGVCTGN